MEFGFRERILVTVAAACAVCAGGAAWVSTVQVKRIAIEDLETKSEAILSRLESARSYVARQGMIDDLIATAVAEHPDGNLPRETREEIMRTVPIYASMQVGQDQAAENHYEFRIAAENPRNEENAPSSVEREFLARFEADPGLEQLVWNSEETDELWVMRPIRLSAADGCLMCHGHPSTSPWGNGKDILGYPMENWSDGQIHGMFAIRSKLAPVRAEANSVALTIAKWSFLLLLGAVAASAVLVGRPLGRFVAQIRQTAARLRGVAEELHASAGIVRQNSDTLAMGAARQAASIEETSAAVTELAASAEENAAVSERAHRAAAQAAEQANAGARDAVKMRDALGTMTEAGAEMAEIIRTIESVAFQTKLLALNAGVEAARAGELGKGFAVVADEVGTLAHRSAEAAKRTDERIRRTMELVGMGAESANLVTEGLAQIQVQVGDTTGLVEHISTASAEQSRTTAQVRSALTQIDQVTQQNAAASEEASSAAAILAEQADSIHGEIVGLLELVSRGSARGNDPGHAAPLGFEANEAKGEGVAGFVRRATRGQRAA